MSSEREKEDGRSRRDGGKEMRGKQSRKETLRRKKGSKIWKK